MEKNWNILNSHVSHKTPLLRHVGLCRCQLNCLWFCVRGKARGDAAKKGTRVQLGRYSEHQHNRLGIRSLTHNHGEALGRVPKGLAQALPKAIPANYCRCPYPKCDTIHDQFSGNFLSVIFAKLLHPFISPLQLAIDLLLLTLSQLHEIQGILQSSNYSFHAKLPHAPLHELSRRLAPLPPPPPSRA